MTFVAEPTSTVDGIRVPDTRLAREITQFVDNLSRPVERHRSATLSRLM
jgi:hypothetical protein